ncbi:MAG: lipopolysaccharide A protein, partial [Muribaculaceae bacterium]|nr:lipopolysaccharide A protein [Muribaculaceae bacterium]
MSKLTGQNKTSFLLRGWLDSVLPAALYSLPRVLDGLTPEQLEQARQRAAYYCRRPLDPTLVDPAMLIRAADFRVPSSKPRHTGYFFPLRRALNYFPQSVRFLYAPGDIYDPFAQPTLCKARCIGDLNATLMPLNAVRHFRFVDSDPTPWQKKRDQIVSRNEVHRPERYAFLQRWFGHPQTDLGQTNLQGGRPEWLRLRMTIDQQLQYKFIACIEGNDVATNLKWVMSSNSLPVMPTPTMESWFQEALLRPGENYVAVAADYSDLLERMDYYLSHPAL